MRFRFLFLILLGLTLGTRAFAISPSSILVNVTPSNPSPNENVNITLSSFLANLDSINISWFVNGKSVLSGIGQKSFSTTAPSAGSNTQVLARIALPDGQIDKSIIISPSVMVLLWQAPESYVPPFYKGKALLTAESDVKVVAMPEIKNASGIVNSKNMTYSWKKNYTNMAGESGYGKNYFTFSTDYLDDSNNVSVVASTIDQQYSSEASLNTNISKSKVLLYKKDEALGTIWERALPDVYKIQGDEVVIAIPYFIAPKNLQRPELVFSWFINNSLVSVPSFQKNLIPLRVEEGTSGVSKLKVQVENKDKLLETASKEINVEF